MHLLVIRFSALGDVAMTVPVLDTIARKRPDLRITVLSRPFVRPLFAGMPQNVSFMGADLKSEFRGVWGIWKLFRHLRNLHIDCIVDLHDVLRTKLLRSLFLFSGTSVASIHKGRKEKRGLVDSKGKRPLSPLASSFERYADTFLRAGIPEAALPEVTHCRGKGCFHSIFGEGKGSITDFSDVVGERDNRYWIGIAPFAAHAGKILPAETIGHVIAHFASRTDCHLFLFGGGEHEKAQMEYWSKEFNNVTSMAGKLKLNGELALMSHLDVMVSMDSANMHLASLVGTPVVSVWGATHPAAGFMGWGQDETHAVQMPLACRPCSIYGNLPCKLNDYACLRTINAEQVIEKINTILSSKGKHENNSQSRIQESRVLY